MPGSLIGLARLSLIAAGICAVVIAIDLIRHPQHMWIMNIVWPVTALWAGPFALGFYFAFGRDSAQDAVDAAKRRGKKPPAKAQPRAIHVAKAALHCGSGCTIGDLCAETLSVAVPLVILGHHIFGSWIYDFALAFAFGIAFQYFTIRPMRDLSGKAAAIAAVKADALSLSAWQLGMYGWMAIATFLIFGHELDKAGPVFWLMMQIAMFLGFLTSYPVNWWLLRAGIKEAM